MKSIEMFFFLLHVHDAMNEKKKEANKQICQVLSFATIKTKLFFSIQVNGKYRCFTKKWTVSMLNKIHSTNRDMI